jgi:hypothetical protein
VIQHLESPVAAEFLDEEQTAPAGPARIRMHAARRIGTAVASGDEQVAPGQFDVDIAGCAGMPDRVFDEFRDDQFRVVGDVLNVPVTAGARHQSACSAGADRVRGIVRGDTRAPSLCG